jgi:beta-glucosidase
MDFLGINMYTCFRPFGNSAEELDKPDVIFSNMDTHKIVGAQYTEKGWEVCPQSLCDLLLRIDKEYNHPLIYITENGMACKDNVITDRVVQDDDRIMYLSDHLKAAHSALAQGVRLKGCFVWSLLGCDNQELSLISSVPIQFYLIIINRK